MFKLFSVYTWDGKCLIMPAISFYKRIMKDSATSNYNWVSSASNILSVCKKKGFPIEYANRIRANVVTCYSELLKGSGTCRGYHEDLNAVFDAYNDLYSVEDSYAKVAREKFLRTILLHAAHNPFLYLTHYVEDSFESLQTQWINEKTLLLMLEEKLDFIVLEETLKEEFYDVVKQAEESGVLIKDVENPHQFWQGVWQQFDGMEKSPLPKSYLLKQNQ